MTELEQLTNILGMVTELREIAQNIFVHVSLLREIAQNIFVHVSFAVLISASLAIVVVIVLPIWRMLMNDK